ncbi:class I SAM-dependent methyltransferase, partial [Candidatus Roizmanbacteria bacterium]|nr:class I SAM-dependent methyltransferase [Candidatus Roizmanbacteria bacterium]
LLAQSVNSSLLDYWDNAFKDPEHLVKYSVQRAWWYAKQNNVSSVLDVGCGNGRLLYGMKCLLPDAALYGVDFSDTGISRMKKEYGIRGRTMDIFDLDTLPYIFDMVVVNDVLEHVEDEKKFIQKCLNRLKDGGIFYLSLPNNYLGPKDTDEHLRLYTEESTRELLDGFPYPYLLELIDIHILCIVKKGKTI